MTTNPFPPQAYTRETLVKAYQWLQNQSPQVKELATTPDLLVSLYVKAKTQGNDFLDRPSLKTFKSELKSLAGMMGEFESADSAQLPPPAPKPTQPPSIQPSVRPEPPPTAVAHSGLNLDTKSLLVVQEVKNTLNLSSEAEAIRLLIAVGHKNLKSLGV